MKFSREYRSENEARARETALRASGFRAWCTVKADGAWEVFWWIEPNPGLSGPVSSAA